jgi:hypothetical protein
MVDRSKIIRPRYYLRAADAHRFTLTLAPNH